MHQLAQTQKSIILLAELKATELLVAGA